MQYLLLLHSDPKTFEKFSDDEMAAFMREHRDAMTSLKASGKYLGSNALEPLASARTVRRRSGKTAVTDGAFAETKEVVGGYYLVEAGDIDEAIAIAARIPDARVGAVVVRGIRDVGL